MNICFKLALGGGGVTSPKEKFLGRFVVGKNDPPPPPTFPKPFLLFRGPLKGRGPRFFNSAPNQILLVTTLLYMCLIDSFSTMKKSLPLKRTLKTYYLRGAKQRWVLLLNFLDGLFLVNHFSSIWKCHQHSSCNFSLIW